MSFLFGRLASNPVLDVVFVVLGVQLLGICGSDLIPIRFRIRRKCVKSRCLFVMVSRMVFVHMRLCERTYGTDNARTLMEEGNPLNADLTTMATANGTATSAQRTTIF